MHTHRVVLFPNWFFSIKYVNKKLFVWIKSFKIHQNHEHFLIILYLKMYSMLYFYR